MVAWTLGRAALIEDVLRGRAGKLANHGMRCRPVNTGWSSGSYGVGERIRIEDTRAMVSAALSGALDDVADRTDPMFGFSVPTVCPDVPEHLLDPRSTWADAAAYDRKARTLAGLFRDNFEQFGDVDEKVRAAGPRV